MTIEGERDSCTVARPCKIVCSNKWIHCRWRPALKHSDSFSKFLQNVELSERHKKVEFTVCSLHSGGKCTTLMLHEFELIFFLHRALCSYRRQMHGFLFNNHLDLRQQCVSPVRIKLFPTFHSIFGKRFRKNACTDIFSQLNFKTVTIADSMTAVWRLR